MSEENVELVRGRFAAALVGDWETALAALDPEIEIHDFDIPDACGVYQGPEGYREWVKHWTEGWESTRMDDPEIRAVARFAVAEIVRIEYFNDQARALEAANPQR